MNAVETLEIIKALHAVGASHFKSHDFEITLKGGTPLEQNIFPPAQVEAQKPSAPVQNEEATERLKELISSLKMDDAQLIDRIFPAGAGG